MSATAVTPPAPLPHDCPHCAEARAIAEQLRALLPEAHALLARLKHPPEPEPHDLLAAADSHNGG